MKLRAYQEQGINDIRRAMISGKRRVVYCLATGGGKTVVASDMITKSVAKRKRVLFLAHRRELIDQTSRKLDAFGIHDHGVIMGNHPRTRPGAQVQVGSVQTVIRRSPQQYDFVYVDECHRTICPTYLEVLAKAGNPWVVGLSATPYRTDDHGLGEFFDGLVQGPSTNDLIDMGYLCPVTIYAPPFDAVASVKNRVDFNKEELSCMDRKELIGDLVRHWKKHAGGRPTVAFSVSIAHAQHIAEAFQAEGVKADFISGKTKKTGPGSRKEKLAQLESGEIKVLANCAVLTEGWDCPPVSCAIIARPTMSRGLWRQMAGRILRPDPSKKDSVILDHGGNYWRHGHIAAPDYVSLQMTRKKAKDENEKTAPATVVCKQCFGVYFRKGNNKCPYCGYLAPPAPIELPKTKQGELKEVKGPIRPNATKGEIIRKMAQLRAVQKARGYHPRWVWHRLKATYGEEKTKEVYDDHKRACNTQIRSTRQAV